MKIYDKDRKTVICNFWSAQPSWVQQP